MKKILLLVLVFTLFGCSEASTQLHMDSEGKKIMLGMMEDATINEFHLTGNVDCGLNDKYIYDIDIDSYNLSNYSLNNLIINNENANVLVKDDKIYVNYQDKSEYIDIDNLDNEKLLKIYKFLYSYINKLSLDSPEALDVLTIYSYFLGHQFVYHFSKESFINSFDDKYLEYLSNDSFVTLTLNYSGNILDSIDVKANLDLQYNDLKAFIKGNLHLALNFEEPNEVDVSKYQKVDKFSFINASNFA